MNDEKQYTGGCSDVVITYDFNCAPPETVFVNDALTKVYQLLKSIGFKLYNPDEYPNPAGFDADFDLQLKEASNLIMIESELSRNMMCIVLSEYDGEYDYEVYVMEDVGCGWVNIPLRWSEISLDWLTHLKMGIEGHGFNV